MKTGCSLEVEDQKAASTDGMEGESVICAKREKNSVFFGGGAGIGLVFQILKNYIVFSIEILNILK